MSHSHYRNGLPEVMNKPHIHWHNGWWWLYYSPRVVLKFPTMRNLCIHANYVNQFSKGITK